MSPREERLRSLVHRFAPEVGAYLRRRSYPLGPPEVDDMVQEVFVVAWRRLDDIPADRELPWLIGTARNVLSNARRSHSRRRALLARVTPRAEEPAAEDYAVANSTLRDALRRLSGSDRELLLLHYWEGLGAPELAVALGIKEGAAFTRLSRATSRLREAYAAVGEVEVKAKASRT